MWSSVLQSLLSLPNFKEVQSLEILLQLSSLFESPCLQLSSILQSILSSSNSTEEAKRTLQFQGKSGSRRGFICEFDKFGRKKEDYESGNLQILYRCCYLRKIWPLLVLLLMIMGPSENMNISLTLHIDYEKIKVLYAEADSDFVNILLSLLTLPLGTVSRLVSKVSTVQPCTFNSISSLRQSVQNLDTKYLSWDWIKPKLLNPLNPMGAESKTLVYNFDDPQMSRGFAGYIRNSASFIVSDDLTLMPSDMNSTLWILQILGIDYVPEKLTVNVNEDEVLDVLKFSLWSKSPLTDLFLHKKRQIQNCQIPSKSKLMKSDIQINEGWKMRLKIMISKSKRKILFAEAEEGLTDQLLSFLTIPVGVVESLAEGNAGLGCMDNLYKSLADNIDSTRYFKSDLKKKLLNPMIASRKVKNQMLPIHYKLSEALESRYACYVKQGTTFMVLDDLSVEPFSSSAALRFLRESKLGEQDLEVRLISIGANEVYEILKAAMFTSSALTIGLSPFLNLVKQET